MKWPTFTFEGYPEERALVREHYAHEPGSGAYSNAPIAISLEDINGDSLPEIIYIVFLHNDRWNYNGIIGFGAINTDGTMQFKRISPVRFRMDSIGGVEGQTEIGLINDRESSWKKFVINGTLWEMIGGVL